VRVSAKLTVQAVCIVDILLLEGENTGLVLFLADLLRKEAFETVQAEAFGCCIYRFPVHMGLF
jgi:hypothetical protein